MIEADLRIEIRRLRVAFLVKLARRLGLETDKESVCALVQTHCDVAVLEVIEARQGWSVRWQRILQRARKRLGFD